jgi:hypothetical protein
VALINNAPPPIGDPIAQPLRKGYKPGTDPQEGYVGQSWSDWLNSLVTNQEKSASRIESVMRTDVADSISPAVDFSGGNLTAGKYRVNYCLLIITPAAGAAALSLTIAWTYRTATWTEVFTIPDSSVVGSKLTGVFMFPIDNLSPITYETAVGIFPAEYDLVLELEELNA